MVPVYQPSQHTLALHAHVDWSEAASGNYFTHTHLLLFLKIILLGLGKRECLIICGATETVLTGVLVQFPARITAGFCESVLADTLAGGFLQNPVGPTQSQQT